MPPKELKGKKLKRWIRTQLFKAGYAIMKWDKNVIARRKVSKATLLQIMLFYWRLQDQKTRFSVHVDREHWYEVHGLGLPFERLSFQAREQFVHAINAHQDLHAERLREKSLEFARTGRSKSI
jgi:hypothetical protein